MGWIDDAMNKSNNMKLTDDHHDQPFLQLSDSGPSEPLELEPVIGYKLPRQEHEEESAHGKATSNNGDLFGYKMIKEGAFVGCDDRLVMVTDPGCIMSEEYRAIRTRILARYNNARHTTHIITSATPREGKTITSMNLGLSFSELSDRRTLVFEGDLRMPTFGSLYPEVDDKPGVIQLLRGEAKLDDVIHNTCYGNLDIIPAGGAAGEEAIRLITSKWMTQSMEILRTRYDHIIVDTPPVLELADAGIVGTPADEVLLVVRCNRTPRHLVDQTVRILNSYNRTVGGIVLTSIPSDSLNPLNRYGYRYHNRTQAYGANRKRVQSGLKKCA